MALALAAVLTLPAAARAGSTLTLWAERSISISGTDNTFCGWAHSNGSVDVTGSRNVVSGGVECVQGARMKDDHNVVVLLPTASAAMPQPAHDLAYYRALAQAAGTYFAGAADLSTDDLAMNGVLFAEQGIKVSGHRAHGSATLVAARGDVKISGSHNSLTPAVDGLLALAAGGNVSIASHNNAYAGSFFAPAGTFSSSGSDPSLMAGQIVAQAIDWSGSGTKVGGQCCATDATCGDGNPCTADACNAGACDSTPIAGCVNCTADTQCDDGNPCSIDTCAGGRCVSAAAADGTPCPDSDLCDGRETCAEGICKAGTPLECDDGNICTDDTCEAAHGCVNSAAPGRSCDNDTVCDGREVCNAAGSCAAGSSPSCDDGNACTADSCDAATGCRHEAIACDDANACTTDACDPAQGCIAAPVTCDDGNACTTDACDPVQGCIAAPVTCDDANACTTDACDPARGCVAEPVTCDDGNACTDDSCDPASGCLSAPVVCEAPNACTTATCDPQRGCVVKPADCDDHDACTEDGCDSSTGCFVVAPVDCDDHDACTTDSCNAGVGCQHQATSCDDANPCTLDRCDAALGCQHTDADGTACSDGNLCNGDETCHGGTCGEGTAPGCDDDNACTDDTCDAALGCQHTERPGCLQCSPGEPCDDQNACTADVCEAGMCVHTPEAGCLPCVTAELCPATICETPTCADGRCRVDAIANCTACEDASECDDGDACTIDACSNGTCSHVSDPDSTDPACMPHPNSAETGEACGDCFDNDGDGLVDYQDPDCCEQSIALGVKSLKLLPTAGTVLQDRLDLRSVSAAPAGFDPLTQDTSVQVAGDDGQIFCATIPAAAWHRTRKGIVFTDKTGRLAGGLGSARFTLKPDGNIVFRVAGRRTHLQATISRRAHVTLRIGGTCADSTATLRPKKTGLVFP